jgi:putative oxidoreductase
MLPVLLHTEPDYVTLLLRVIAGIIILPYGLKKLGWLKGPGNNSFSKMREMGVPLLLSWLITIAQTLGAIALLVGFLGRIAAAGNLVIMFGAMLYHVKDGWSMNWYGEKKGEGIEYFVMLLGILLAIIINGSGAWSIDIVLQRNFSYHF